MAPDTGPTRDELWRLLAAIVLQAEGRVQITERALVLAEDARLLVRHDDRGRVLLEYLEPADTP